MKRSFLSWVFVVFLLLPATGVTAQDGPLPVPEATIEPANVGQAGPGLETGDEPQTMAGFVGMVSQDTSVMWANLFQIWGVPYVPSTYITLDSGTYARSSCGINAGNPTELSSLNPALYCIYGGEMGTQGIESSTMLETQVMYSPVVYVSLPWLEESVSDDLSNSDFTVAYRVAFESAHHVQYLLGYIDHTGGGCCEYTDVQIELMADCLVGVWAFSAYDQGQLEESDVQEAQGALWDSGVDAPKEFGRRGEHGTPEQRIQAFMRGYDSGNASHCFEDDAGS